MKDTDRLHRLLTRTEEPPEGQSLADAVVEAIGSIIESSALIEIFADVLVGLVDQQDASFISLRGPESAVIVATDEYAVDTVNRTASALHRAHREAGEALANEQNKDYDIN